MRTGTSRVKAPLTLESCRLRQYQLSLDTTIAGGKLPPSCYRGEARLQQLTDVDQPQHTIR